MEYKNQCPKIILPKYFSLCALNNVMLQCIKHLMEAEYQVILLTNTVMNGDHTYSHCCTIKPFLQSTLSQKCVLLLLLNVPLFSVCCLVYLGLHGVYFNFYTKFQSPDTDGDTLQRLWKGSDTALNQNQEYAL